MSYHVNVPRVLVKDLDRDLDKAVRPHHRAADPEARVHLEGAVAAVKALVGGGAFGGPDAALAISISGHANPEHRQREGDPVDQLNVSIYQLEPGPLAVVCPPGQVLVDGVCVDAPVPGGD